MAGEREEQVELEQRAHDQVDQDRLLEGEDPSTAYIEDAAHWVTVYAEILLFKERLVDAAQGGMLQMTHPVARKEATEVDLPVLLSERERLRRRLDFWQGRQRELGRSRGHAG